MFEIGDVLTLDTSAPPVDPDDRRLAEPAAASWQAMAHLVESKMTELGFRRWNGPPMLSRLRGRDLVPRSLPLLLREVRPDIEDGVIELLVIGEREDVLATRSHVRAALTGLLTRLGLRWLVSVGLPCLDAHRRWDLGAARSAEDVPVQNIESLVSAWLHDGPPTPSDFTEVADCGCEGPYLLDELNVAVVGVDEPWSAWCRVSPGRLAAAVAFGRSSRADRTAPTVGRVGAG